MNDSELKLLVELILSLDEEFLVAYSPPLVAKKNPKLIPLPIAAGSFIF
jgi:hypothetical protein